MKSYPIARSGMIEDLKGDQFPTRFRVWKGADALALPEEGTHIGFVQQGRAELSFENQSFSLSQGMYFSLPCGGTIIGSHDGEGVVMTRQDFRGFFQVGGPIEERGRLTYIDGCTDSLLISPVVMGDPCLNLLHIPANTEQTQHTHPSLRLGVIVSGTGICKTPGNDLPLSPGLIFYIPADSLHSFHTADESLRVIAYHPDSDYGPTHQNHPMVNKTIIS